MTKPVLFMAMPHYGGIVHAEAAKAFWVDAVSVPDSLDVITVDHGSSLLAKTFNEMWCAALNMRAAMPPELKGRTIDMFAMLHSDIAPERGWLNVLVGELLRTGADLCSAAVPIKTGDGLTSVAISGDDPFVRTRRLTINEVRKLPETFTAEDCGYPSRVLLANTGCFVCRFNRPWVEKVHFEIRGRIVLDQKTGLFETQVLPEDWHFSQQLAALGGKIVCTRKVPVRHFGSASFTMDKTNGRDIDWLADGNPLPCFGGNGIPVPETVALDGYYSGAKR